MAGTEEIESIVNSECAVPVELGEVVLVKGEKIIGVVSYIGSMFGEDPSSLYVGLTLSDPIKNGHNGTARGHQYFECADKHGIIINSHSVSRRVSPPELLQKVTTLNNAFKECFSQTQSLKQKLNMISETLSRVEGENHDLREKVRYYEEQLNYHAPFLNNGVSHNLEESPSPSPGSPTRMRSQSHQIHSHKRRTFNKPLPPLPPHKPHQMHDATKEQRRVVAKYKKKSYEKRRKLYAQRSNSRQSFKSRRHRNPSDASKSTFTSTAQTLTSTVDQSVSASPIPLSIGDESGTFKLLIPNNKPKYGKRGSYNSGGSCNESESHDVGDLSQFDDQDIIDGDDLFPIKGTPRYTNKYIPHDDDDAENEYNELDIDQITMSYASTKNIYERSEATTNANELSLLTPNVNELKAPGIIQESPHIANGDDTPQTLDTPQTEDYEESPESSYIDSANQAKFEVDGDNHLEIESSMPTVNTKPDVHIKVYEPQKEWQIITSDAKENHTETKQSQGNGNSNHVSAVSGNSAATFKSSIPDNVGLYTEQEHIAATLISDSQSNPRSITPSYTQSNPRSTLTTISPHKSLRQRVLKRKSLTPAQIKMPSKFNPTQISKSQVRLSDVSHDQDDADGAFVKDILYSMSDDNTSNNSHNINIKAIRPHNTSHNIAKKRKSMGIPTDRKKLKKRVIRSRTFVSNTSGQKYDTMKVVKGGSALNMYYEEEKSPQPLLGDTPILVATSPQTTPLHALHPPHTITLDDFELNQVDINNNPQYNQHPFQHQHYHSSIQLASKKTVGMPPHHPTLSSTLSADRTNNVNGFRRHKQKKPDTMNVPPRKQLQRTKSSPCRQSRNLGSLTDRELKGFLEADNLFMYNNYQ